MSTHNTASSIPLSEANTPVYYTVGGAELNNIQWNTQLLQAVLAQLVEINKSLQGIEKTLEALERGQ